MSGVECPCCEAVRYATMPSNKVSVEVNVIRTWVVACVETIAEGENIFTKCCSKHKLVVATLGRIVNGEPPEEVLGRKT